MKNETDSSKSDKIISSEAIYHYDTTAFPQIASGRARLHEIEKQHSNLAEILVISSYPPRECGIATYSQDLIKALNNKFSNSFNIKVCALESGKSDFNYPDEVKYTLDTSHISTFMTLAEKINNDQHIEIVLIQHEFGFYREQEQAFLQMLYELSKPVVIVFHTVLPHPTEHLKNQVRNIASACKSIIVMTKTSADILMSDYNVASQKISIIRHGTHLVQHLSEKFLKDKYGLTGKKVLTTFGLLSSGKSIETTLDALPAIVKQIPNVMFLIIGKTHPEVVKNEKEQYRDSLELKVKELGLENNVQFINKYLDLPDLLEYLQLTDIYVFTTNDPNQAVSGTFMYAMSCGCPIISTPIPHAKEVLTEDTGIIFDFRNSGQLADGVIRLLNDPDLRKNIISNTLQKVVSTAWENSAVAHAMLIQKMAPEKIKIHFNLPVINLSHVKAMTTEMGMIQFSRINQPDIKSGYTLDDNARALVATCMYLNTTGDKSCISDIRKYLNFIRFCQQPDGNFLNYVDKDKQFTSQNEEVNLDDSNGRAVWALGYMLSQKNKLPKELSLEAEVTLQRAFILISEVKSTRAMAFAIKGIFYYHKVAKLPGNITLVKIFANRMLQMYKHESGQNWEWFEGYLTYANSILPEAMLYAWLMTDDSTYKDIAKISLAFLLSHTFNANGIEVISNRKWFQKGQEHGHFGEQPIDVAYTIMTLGIFYDVFHDDDYLQKLHIAFNWFLGNNRLQQIVYNPCTGGCYDGMEETHVNLNQGAESTVSYLMARLTVEKYKDEQ
ncbi:MAG: glycosyltransferase [Paludibacter sp.]|nr:glycosyltransferase [Paludibacter sp.]